MLTPLKVLVATSEQDKAIKLLHPTRLRIDSSIPWKSQGIGKTLQAILEDEATDVCSISPSFITGWHITINRPVMFLGGHGDDESLTQAKWRVLSAKPFQEE